MSRNLLSQKNSPFSTYLPELCNTLNSKLIYFLYTKHDNIRIEQFLLGDNEPRELLEIEDVGVANFYTDLNTFIVSEERDDNVRCYVAKLGQEFSRIEKSDYCFPVPNGSLIYSLDENRDGFSVKALSINDKKEYDFLEITDDANIWLYDSSEDGSLFLYVEADEKEEKIYLLDVVLESEDIIHDDFYSVLDASFLPENNTLYYIVEGEDGILRLFVGDDNRPIEEAAYLYAQPSKDGNNLIYLSGDGYDSLSINSYHLTNEQSEEIYEGSQISFALLDSFGKILILDKAEDQEVTILTSDMDGKDLVELFQDDDYQVEQMSYVNESNKIFIDFENDDNLNSLYISSVDQEDGFFVLDEWAEYQLLDISSNGRYLTFSGREDDNDDPALFSVEILEDVKFIELDDDFDNVSNAVFSSNGNNIIYTVVTGSDYDDVDVMRVDINRENRPEMLYKEAELLDVSWSNMEPFRYADFYNASSGTSMCPGAAILDIGKPVTGRVDNPETPSCYRIDVEENLILSIKINDLDSDPNENISATIFSRDGNDTLVSREVDSEYPLILSYYFDVSGTFYVQIEREDANNSEFSIELNEMENLFEIAEVFYDDFDIQGTLTSSTQVFLPNGDDTYGSLYAVDLDKNDRILIEQSSDDMDSYLVIYDENQNVVATDDDSGSGSDARILFFAGEDGLYYILAGKYGSSPPEGNASFKLSVDYIVDSFSSASPLSFNSMKRESVASSDRISSETVRLPENYGDMYYFDAEEGQQITISVDAREIGSDLDPHIYLYSTNLELLAVDDDSGPGYDSKIVVTNSYLGRYYLLVTNHSGGYGSSNSYFYEITIED